MSTPQMGLLDGCELLTCFGKLPLQAFDPGLVIRLYRIALGRPIPRRPGPFVNPPSKTRHWGQHSADRSDDGKDCLSAAHDSRPVSLLVMLLSAACDAFGKHPKG